MGFVIRVLSQKIQEKCNTNFVSLDYIIIDNLYNFKISPNVVDLTLTLVKVYSLNDFLFIQIIFRGVF